jgi:general secretion pathway protein C
LVGEKVGVGVKLVGVEGDGVVIELGGKRISLDLDKLPEGPVLPRLVRP